MKSIRVVDVVFELKFTKGPVLKDRQVTTFKRGIEEEEEEKKRK